MPTPSPNPPTINPTIEPVPVTFSSCFKECLTLGGKRAPFYILLGRGISLAILIWFLLVFLGMASFPFFKNSYDDWRLGQIILLTLVNIASLLLPKPLFLPFRAYVYPFYGVSFGVILLVLFGVVNVTALLTYGIMLASLVMAAYFILLFSEDARWQSFFWALLSLSAFPVMVKLVANITLKFFLPWGVLSWHETFSNIRYLDDAVIPLLALLWLRPGFLAQSKWTPLIFLMGVLYLMNLFFDGARSALLSVGVVLFLLLLFSQKKKEELLLPLVSLIVAFLLYFIINKLLASAGHTLVRTTTSGRSALYLSSLAQFFEQPLFGVGGGNFKAWYHHPTSHPHSFVFKWLVEGGLVGVGFLLLFFWGAWLIFSQGRKVQGWAWAAPAMVTVNALFSGGFVYPLSQFLSFLLFAYGISLVLSSSEIRKSPTAPTTFTAPMIGGTPILATTKSGGLSAFIVIKILSLVAIILMIGMTAKTLPIIKKMDLAEDFGLETRAQYREYFRLSHGPGLWQRGPIIEFDGTLKEYRRPEK